MKVMLVNGSPHKEGSTYHCLVEIQNTLTAEGIGSDILWLGSKPIIGCQGCGACRKLGKCVHNDIVNEFLAAAGEYDGFIFGTPVHYAAASGAITSFMDRIFYAGSKELYYMKPAAAISIARRGGTTATWDQLNKYFGISQMPIVTSQYWNMVHGAFGEQVKEDLEGMQTMRTLARNMAYLLKCLDAGRKSGVQLPETEAKLATNFIR